MTLFGYIRTSRHLQEGVAGMDPFSQELRFREAGVQRDNVYRDIGVSGATGTDQRQGWHRLDGRLSGGDILVVVRIDRIGRRWLDTLQCIIALRARGVKIRSLDETEGWTRFLELAPDDPLAFVGHQMVSMAAWVADQEREVGRRRTREGLAAARARGKTLGRRRSLTDDQVQLARRGFALKALSDAKVARLMQKSGAGAYRLPRHRTPALLEPPGAERTKQAAQTAAS